MTTPTLLTFEEVREHLRVSPGTLRGLIERAELKARKVGAHWRIRSDDLNAFLEGPCHSNDAAKTYPDPDASIVWGEGGWQYGDGRQVTTGAWVFPSKVAVKLLGTAAAGMKPGAVVGSFNAG